MKRTVSTATIANPRVAEGRHVPVHVTGVVNSTPFEGVDIIKVIK